MAFRAWTCSAARQAGVRGWVRNLPDGTVEIQAAGGEDELERLLRQLRAGPPAARVDEIEESRLEGDGMGSGFSVVY